MAKQEQDRRPRARVVRADEPHRAPGFEQRIKHDAGTDELHVSVSLKGWGRLRRLTWDANELVYEIEGKPDALSFHVIPLEGE